MSGFLPGFGALENGRHVYEFAFLPHKGTSLREAVRLGAEFNTPLLALPARGGAGTLPGTESFLSISGAGVIVSALKKASRRKGLVLRLYETLGRKCKVKLKFAFPVKEMWGASAL